MAEKAEYTNNSLRFSDDEKLKKYFIETESSYRLKDIYRTGISFSQGNILDLSSYRKPYQYDVIFCRNVLIYFTEAAIYKAIKHFARCLREGGLLFLGHSESIIGISQAFKSIRYGNCIVYEKS